MIDLAAYTHTGIDALMAMPVCAVADFRAAALEMVRRKKEE